MTSIGYPTEAGVQRDRWRGRARAAAAAKASVSVARAVRIAVNAVRSRLVAARHPALTVTGFGCLSAAAFQLGLAVGLACTGVLVLAFDVVTGSE
jgi:hypothetical protein